jgi:hypothetical protein
MSPQFSAFIAEWRARIAMFRRHGIGEAATTGETFADELEAFLRTTDDMTLTIAQAAAESGYSEDHLARQIREGKIPNAGRPGAPRIRRADLPRKPRVVTAGAGIYDAGADARSLLADRLQTIGGAHGG